MRRPPNTASANAKAQRAETPEPSVSDLVVSLHQMETEMVYNN